MVIAIDVSTEPNGTRVASIVATNRPYEGSLSGMKAIVTKVDMSQKLGDMVSTKFEKTTFFFYFHMSEKQKCD